MTIQNTGEQSDFCVPKGFAAAGAHIGVKKQKKDLCLVASDLPCVCAGTYTQNLVKAAPVLWCESVTRKGEPVFGLAVNSGNANACTGEAGRRDAAAMARAFAAAIGKKAEEVLVCSTGVIGVGLPVDIITEGITKTAENLAKAPCAFVNAARAIMTTDTFEKTASEQITLGGKTVTLFGMAKGSGMICPNMATLLCFVLTDCAVERAALDAAFAACVDDTFNMLSVDGDTSTNDTALVLANGAAQNTVINEQSADYGVFKSALLNVTRKLAVDIAKDGEGATRLMRVNVHGAKTKNDARLLAKSVVKSNLFKAALFGGDANWGRVLCALGYSGARFNPDKTDLYFKSAAGEVCLFKSGCPEPFSEQTAKAVLSERQVDVDIHINEGDCGAAAYGCDLTYDYVKINGDYRT